MVMEKEDVEYIISCIEFAVEEGVFHPNLQETLYNLYANSLNILNEYKNNL